MKSYLLERINSIARSDKSMYLLKLVDQKSGFFFTQDKLLFCVKASSNTKSSIDTNDLSLRTYIFIDTIENTPSFTPGYYDVLIYNGSLEESLLDVFVNICIAYINSSTPIIFSDFFYAILELFQLPKQQTYKNLIGFYGELSLIDYFEKHYNLNISDYWHYKDFQNKYDFIIKNIKLETKTTSKEGSTFRIKHDQIFNHFRIYLSLVNIEENDGGRTIFDYISYFRESPKYSRNFDFQVKLEKELRRINKLEGEVKKFKMISLGFYLNKELEKITEYPTPISNIEYDYDFGSQKLFSEISLVEEIINEIKNEN